MTDDERLIIEALECYEAHIVDRLNRGPDETTANALRLKRNAVERLLVDLQYP